MNKSKQQEVIDFYFPMKKLNERNAGRKKVLNGQRVILTVPKDKVQELKDFAKNLIVYVGIQGKNDK